MDLIWKDHPDYAGVISVSNHGDVYNNVTNKKITPHIVNGGYYHCVFSVDGVRHRKYVHRLVMETFSPTSDTSLEVNHIDLDKSNNKLTNLEWVTHHENIIKFYEHYGRLKATKQAVCGCGNTMYYTSKKCKLCEITFRKENSTSKVKPPKEELYEYMTSVLGNFSDASRKYGVSDNAVRKWCRKYGIPSHSRDYKALA